MQFGCRYCTDFELPAPTVTIECKGSATARGGTRLAACESDGGEVIGWVVAWVVLGCLAQFRPLTQALAVSDHLAHWLSAAAFVIAAVIVCRDRPSRV